MSELVTANTANADNDIFFTEGRYFSGDTFSGLASSSIHIITDSLGGCKYVYATSGRGDGKGAGFTPLLTKDKSNCGY